jgi:hypothetical protein
MSEKKDGVNKTSPADLLRDVKTLIEQGRHQAVTA